MDRSAVVFFLCFLVGSVFGNKSDSQAQLVNNGYQNVLVGISPDIQVQSSAEANQVVKDIQTILTKASTRLFNATRNRAYLSDVHVLIPDSWPPVDQETDATWERFVDSDVRVDTFDPLHGDIPYAVQPRGCGQPGDYIHITQQFLANGQEHIEKSGSQLVHVWSQYRYGIYEEYGHPGDAKYPMFYWTTGSDVIQFTSCTDTPLNGQMIDVVTGGGCSVEPTTKLPDSNCAYIFDNVTAESSILTNGYIKSIYTFCDDADHPHNAEAPNRQNDLCNGQSTWSVVTQNVDFANGANPPIANDEPPTFTIVRKQTPTKVVFVIDTSGNMAPNDRIDWASKGTQYWILETVPQGIRIGMVEYNAVATKRIDLTEVTDQGSRQAIADAVPTTCATDISLAIGAGILKGIEVLKGPSGTESTEGDIMLLLAAGEESVEPYIRDVLNDVVESGIRVLTVAAGSASADLELVAQVSHGWTYSVSDAQNIKGYNAVLQFLTDLVTPTSQQQINVYKELFLPSSDDYDGTFAVDAAFNRDMGIELTFVSGGLTEATFICDRSGIVLNLKDATHFSQLNTFRFSEMPNGAGIWTFNIKHLPNTTGATLRVFGTTEETVPILAEASAHLLSHSGYDIIHLFAKVTRGYDPVVGAKVTAMITMPDGTQVRIPLLDDGNAVSDTAGNDGVYSGLLTQYGGVGRYSYEVVAEGVRNKTHILTEFAGSKRDITSDGINTFRAQDSRKFTRISSGDFQRVASGDSIYVGNPIPPSKDVLPPGKINSLEASISAETELLFFSWIASGGDLDRGTASELEMRYSSTNRTDLRRNFDKATGVLPSDIRRDGLTPLASGMIQRVALFLPKCHKVTCFFALRATDSAGNVGDISNVVRIN